MKDRKRKERDRDRVSFFLDYSYNPEISLNNRLGRFWVHTGNLFIIMYRILLPLNNNNENQYYNTQR